MGFMDQARESEGMKAIGGILDGLKAKDGYVHVLYLNMNGKLASNSGLQCDSANTKVVDELLSEMQNRGREIVDVKFSITSTTVLFRSVQILYK